MLELQGKISDDGKLSVYNQQQLDAWRLKYAGSDIVLSVKLKRKKRSNPQNAYYWGVVVPMVTAGINQFGNDFEQEETHEFLKARFNAKEIELIEGHYIEMPQSTASLDTKEFMSYLEQIQQFASSMLGLYIANPNEQTTIDFYLNQPQ